MAIGDGGESGPGGRNLRLTAFESGDHRASLVVEARSAFKAFQENRKQFLDLMDSEVAKARKTKADLGVTIDLLDQQAVAIRDSLHKLKIQIAAGQIFQLLGFHAVLDVVIGRQTADLVIVPAADGEETPPICKASTASWTTRP